MATSGLRINTNVPALNAGRTLNNSTQRLNRTLEQLSSGLRINRARDDAAGLAISEGLSSIVRGTIVAQRNVQDGISLVQTAEGALNESTAILQRMREISVQAANGTLTDSNRAALDSELRALMEQLDDIAHDTEFNGTRVLSGSGTVTLQAGAREGQTLEVGINGANTRDLVLSRIAVSSLDSAQSAITLVDSAIQRVSAQRGTLGAVQNRLEFTVNTLAIQEQESASSRSGIRDANLARTTIDFTREQILVSAGTTVLAQANVLPQSALQLLG
jgi:flagellin